MVCRPDEAMPILRTAARAALGARRDEADALYRLAQATGSDQVSQRRRQEALILLDEAVRGYERAMGATRRGDQAIVRRGIRAP